MKRLRTCIECGETKEATEFSIVNSKRVNICKLCADDDAENKEFKNAIADMDYFTPVDELEDKGEEYDNE